MTKYRCQYVDNGITFFYDAVRICCKSAHNGVGKPFLSNYSTYDVDQIIKKKQEYKQKLYSGEIPCECQGCVFVKETDTLNEDNSIYFIDIDSFNTCNSLCVYCEVRKQNFTEKPVLPIFKDLFKRKLLKNHEHGYISFAGGEPTLMKDFDKVVDLCIKSGIQNYMIHTNAIKFSKSIEKLLKKTNAKVIVSLDSSCEETFLKVKKVPQYKNVISNLKRYAKAQKKNSLALRSKYIIIPGYNDSIEEIEKWYDLSVSLGIKFLILDVEMIWFNENNQQITPQIQKMVDVIKERCIRDNIVLDFYESLKVYYKAN